MKYTKITISGKIATGKTTLFKTLQIKLNWPTFSSSQLFKTHAKINKLSLEKAEEQNGKITREIDSKIYELLKTSKKLIVEGWMAGVMADCLPGVLRIMLICDDKERVRRVAQREGVFFKMAKKLLSERENNWLEKIEKIYKRRDIFDPKYYDLVIDTTNLKPKEIVNKVLDSLQKPE